MLKKYKAIVIVAGIVVFVVLALALAVALVGHSYSSEEYVAVREVTGEEDLAAPSVEDDFQMEREESEDGERSRVSKMYNEDRVESDFEKLMEEKEVPEETQNALNGILDEIYENAPDFFEQFVSRDSGDPIESEPNYFNADENPDLTDEDILLDSDYSVIRDSLTVIGLFDNNKVVYAYDFPESNLLVCVDYSDTLFLEETDEVWKIGDVRGVAIDSEYSTKMEAAGYVIIFTRG